MTKYYTIFIYFKIQKTIIVEFFKKDQNFNELS